MLCRFVYTLFFLHYVSGLCYNLTANDVCSTILPYTNTYIQNGVCPSSVDGLLSSSISPSIFGSFSTNCATHIARWQCAKAYPPCPSAVPPCQTMCTDLIAACDTAFPAVATLLSINCTQQPTTNCNMFPVSAIPPPQASCQPYSGTVCKGIIPQNQLVFVPPYSSIAGEEFILSQVHQLWSIIPYPCLLPLATFLCQQSLPRCDQTSNVFAGVPIIVPSPPCNGECQAVMNNSLCQMFYQSAAGTALNASLPFLKPSCNLAGNYYWSTRTTCGVSSALPDFPVSTNIFGKSNVTNQVISSQCTVLNAASSVITSVQCVYPLVSSTDYANNVAGGLCAVACPPSVGPYSDMMNVNYILSSLSTVSFFCCVFLTLTWSVFKEKRQQRFILYFLANITSIFFMFFVIVLATNGNFGQVSCKSQTQQCAWGDTGWCSLCVAQSILFVFNVLSGTGWWAVIAIDLFIKVYFPSLSVDGKRNARIALHVFGISFPVPFFLAALATKSLAADGGVYWCFYNSAAIVQDSTFWGPVLGLGIVVSFVMALVLYKIHLSSLAANARITWTRYIRPVAFVFVFYWFISYTEYVHLYGTANADALNASALKWFTCLLTTPTQCGKYPDFHLDVGVGYLANIAVSFVGISIFLVYGLNADTLALWKNLLMGRGLGTSDHSTDPVDISKTGASGVSLASPRSKTGNAKSKLNNSSKPHGHHGPHSNSPRGQHRPASPATTAATSTSGKPHQSSETAADMKTAMNVDVGNGTSSSSSSPDSSPTSPVMAASPASNAPLNLNPMVSSVGRHSPPHTPITSPLFLSGALLTSHEIQIEEEDEQAEQPKVDEPAPN